MNTAWRVQPILCVLGSSYPYGIPDVKSDSVRLKNIRTPSSLMLEFERYAPGTLTVRWCMAILMIGAIVSTYFGVDNTALIAGIG